MNGQPVFNNSYTDLPAHFYLRQMPATAVLDQYPGRFEQFPGEGMSRKLGLARHEEDDAGLADDFLRLLAENQLDFTLAFRWLSEQSNAMEMTAGVDNIFHMPTGMAPWIRRWEMRASGDSPPQIAARSAMLRLNPAYIPRNHLLEKVIDAASQEEDFQPFHKLVEVLSKPFEYRPGGEKYALPPAEDEIVRQTFCGT